MASWRATEEKHWTPKNMERDEKGKNSSISSQNSVTINFHSGQTCNLFLLLVVESFILLSVFTIKELWGSGFAIVQLLPLLGLKMLSLCNVSPVTCLCIRMQNLSSVLYWHSFFSLVQIHMLAYHFDHVLNRLCLYCTQLTSTRAGMSFCPASFDTTRWFFGEPCQAE